MSGHVFQEITLFEPVNWDGRMRALNLELKIEHFDLATSPVSEDTHTYPNLINAFTVYTINLSTLLISTFDYALTPKGPFSTPLYSAHFR